MNLRRPVGGLVVLLALLGLALLAAGCSSGSASSGSASSGSASTRHVALAAGPAAAAVDAPVYVTVGGLPATGLVTLRGQARDDVNRLWESQAQFRATAGGTLDLATAVPVLGSYHVADAAGLLWSLQPAYTASAGAQYVPKNTGFDVTVQVLVGGHVEATATLCRELIAPASVQTVSRDGFAGTLFTPAKAAAGAPAVVVIGGANGGEETFIAGALAQAGYPALALGYFDEPGLPRCLCDIPLEYFARATHWLSAQPAARGRPVVLIGDSRGAEAALLIASYEPHLFDAVVANSPSYLINGASGGTRVDGAAWTFGGKPLTTGKLIPVTNIRVPLLLSDGGQDLIWPSASSASRIVTELRGSADHAPYTNLYYPDAGHVAAGYPPDFPYSADTLGVPRGGTAQGNALAHEQFWTKLLAFLNDPSA